MKSDKCPRCGRTCGQDGPPDGEHWECSSCGTVRLHLGETVVVVEDHADTRRLVGNSERIAKAVCHSASLVIVGMLWALCAFNDIGSGVSYLVGLLAAVLLFMANHEWRTRP